MSRRLLPLSFVIASAACGSSGGGGGPSQTPSPSPTPDAAPPVMTITASGVDPQVLHAFDSNEPITFANDDVRPHDIRSDPHPAHTDCPSLNLGIMAPGERRAIDGATLPRFTLCYYHDEIDPTNNAYRGVIVTH